MPRMLKNFFITGMIALFATASFAQKGVEDRSQYGHGEDSLRCIKNLSLFTEYVKQKSYADAIPSWEICYNECPLAHLKIYTDGVKIMQYRIKQEKDAAKKEALIQQLLGVYDQRIKYFGDDKKYGEAFILGAKGMEILDYKTDADSRKSADEWFKKSIEGQKNSTPAAILVSYLQNSVTRYKAGQTDAEDVVKSYITVSDILDKQILTSKKPDQLKGLKDSAEKLFASSGAADCETIEKIFGPQLEENKTNVDWLKLVNKLLARANCEDAQLLYDVSESLHAIEPSSSSAYGLARMYLKSHDLDKAAEYYNEAINLEEDPSSKGTYYYQLGLVKYSQEKFVEAKQMALKAAELKAEWGDPYILLGKLYGTAAKNFGKDEFEHATAYWAAVDQFYKAKSIDASATNEANELIAFYSKYFPATDEIFFHNLQVGDSYTVGGWIGVTTKVRAK